MIYEAFKGLLLFLLKAPAGPPAPPAGSPESVQTFRASAKFLLYRLVVLSIIFGPLVIGACLLAIVITTDRQTETAVKVIVWILPIGLMLAGLISYFLARLDYDMRYYIVTDRSLRIREGAWTIREVTLTYANVQHLEIQQGPIERLLGIANVFVRTAGGAGPAVPQGGLVAALLFSGKNPPGEPGMAMGHVGILRGIDNAQEVRDRINALLKKYRDAGLGEPEGRRRTVAAALGSLSPDAVARLREILDELRAWRQSLTPRDPQGAS